MVVKVVKYFIRFHRIVPLFKKNAKPKWKWNFDIWNNSSQLTPFGSSKQTLSLRETVAKGSDLYAIPIFKSDFQPIVGQHVVNGLKCMNFFHPDLHFRWFLENSTFAFQVQIKFTTESSFCECKSVNLKSSSIWNI